MNLEQAKTILESLLELEVGESYGYLLRQKRKEKSIEVMKELIKELKHQQLKYKVGAGHLDSIEKCPQCEDGIVISKMSGGYHCNKCDYGEIAF